MKISIERLKEIIKEELEQEAQLAEASPTADDLLKVIAGLEAKIRKLELQTRSHSRRLRRENP